MTGTHTTHALHTVGRILAGQPAGGLSDRELLRRFAASRDEGAFAALVQRHGPMVLATCRRVLHNAHDADDVFQAAFLTLARKASAAGWQESVAAWLHVIAYRLALKVRADVQRRTAAEPPPERPSADPLAEVSGRELCAILDEELSALPESYRAPLVLCCLEGLSRDEAAQRLGWSQGSVKGRLERGRELLRRRLERRGVALSAGLAGLALASGARAAVAPGLRAAVVAAAVGRGAGASARVVALAATALRGGAAGRGKLVAALFLALVAAGAGLGLLRPPAPEPERKPDDAAPAARSEEARPAEKDAAGDPLPAGAVSRLGTLRFRHASTIYSIAFAPDGKVVATGSLDNTVRLWDTATGKELARLGWHNGPKIVAQVISVAFSPDGKTVASGSNDGTVRLWDPKTGKALHEIESGQGLVAAMAFGPEGKTLVTAHGEGKCLIVWDAATGKEQRRLTGHADALSAVACSEDGKLIVSGSADHSVRVWDAVTGRELHKFDAGAHVEGVALSPDGKLAASAAREEGVRLWDVVAGKPAGKLPFPEESVNAVAFAPDGKTLAASSMTSHPEGGEVLGRVVLFDVGARKALRQLTEGDHYPIKTVAFSRDGKTVAAAGWVNGSLRLWDAATGKELRADGGHTAQITAAVFTHDGRRVVTSAWDETARVWDAATGKELRRLPGSSVYLRQDYRDMPPTVAYLRSDGKTLLTVTGPKDPTAHFHDIDTGKELRKLALPAWDVRQTIDPAGTTLARPDEDGTIRLYDLATGKERARLAGHEGLLWLTFSADGRRLASSGPASVIVWDAVAGKQVRTFGAKELRMADGWPACSYALSPDGTLLAGRCADGQVGVWDVATGKEWLHLETYEGDWQMPLQFSPDGRMLVTAGQNSSVALWEVASGKERRRLDGHKGSVDVVSFSRDGRLLVTGGSETAALVWELRPRGKPLTADALKAAWTDLASDDAARAYRAVQQLAASPADSVPFLKEALPVVRADEKRIARLVAQLDSDDFGTREKATSELEAVGEAAVPALRAALAGRPSAELRVRCDGLLAKLDVPASSDGRLRTLRAVEALEQAEGREARDLLRRLADGADGARLTREAKAALKRLEQ
jgi:RNA polymerase sigma factor (sigma-70 family)